MTIFFYYVSPLYTGVGKYWFTYVRAVCLSLCLSPIHFSIGLAVVFGAILNVGQHHRRRANINPANCFKASCWYRQHEVLTRAEWILPNTDDAGPTFNRHWIGVNLYSVDTPPPTESTVQCWMVDGQSRRQLTSVEQALGLCVVFARHDSVVGTWPLHDTSSLSCPANTGYSHNAVSLLAHRLRLWPIMETALGEWPVFAGY